MTAFTPRSSFFGLFSRKERWSLSRRGWLLLFLVVAATATLFFFRIHPFLAVTERVDTDLLVVEGWIPQPAFKECVTEFNARHYRKIFVTGGPVLGRGPVSEYDTFGHAGFVALAGLGLPPDSLQKVPARAVERDRTYAAAVALRDWFKDNRATNRAFNVVTSGVHARRTRLLFQKAFGSQVAIGIISIPSQDYDADQWYHYSEGVKEVMSEGAAYVYARCFFHPAPSR